MGFLQVLRKMKQQEQEIRILILGLDNSGKTTLLKKLTGEDPSEVSPTVGFNIRSLDYRGFILNLWDIGGQKSLRTYWKNYFESTDGVIWVIDSADILRLGDGLGEFKSLLGEERLYGASVLVLANKVDLPGASSISAIEGVFKLEELKSHHCRLLPCSAITGENVMDGVDWLVNDISSRIFSPD